MVADRNGGVEEWNLGWNLGGAEAGVEKEEGRSGGER